MANVLLVHWKPEEAAPRAAALEKAGHSVRFLAPKGTPPLRALVAHPPGAIVIDLGRLPSQGRDVATALRQRRATRSVPLLFVEGDPGKTARVKALLPDAVYTTWRGLAGALRKALAAKPNAKPVVPGTMAGYSGTPLPKKLGIKTGSAVALLGAPEGFATKTLGPLPERVVVRGDARSAFTVGLLFARSRSDLARRFAAATKAMGDPGALWIVWPKKASGVPTDLDENVVRAYGLARGLVDYKIAAIDATWSGLCFARRRPTSEPTGRGSRRGRFRTSGRARSLPKGARPARTARHRPTSARRTTRADTRRRRGGRSSTRGNAIRSTEAGRREPRRPT